MRRHFLVNVRALFRALARSTVRRGRRERFAPVAAGWAPTIDEMSREELIAYARGIDTELARLTGQHAKPLARVVKIARVSAYHGELGVMTAFDACDADTRGYDSAFHIVFEIAEQALRRARLDRLVERQLARDYPEATAALVAMRRYVLRDGLDWPHAARLDYERNVLADALALTSPQLRHRRMEYWASLLDVFPSDEFDVAAKASQYQVNDGTTALEEGIAAGRKRDIGSDRDNRYAPGTFLHAKWIEGYQRGRREAFVARGETSANPDGISDRGRHAPPNA
jgi:hypothetical protein